MIITPSPSDQYIGDGLYVQSSGYGFWLYVPNDMKVLEQVHIDAGDINTLVEWINSNLLTDHQYILAKRGKGVQP